ncbi:MAG: hypothetical protein ABIN67_04040 [Ferruginibacter sp.]
MKIEKYPVIVGATSMVYEFVSEGSKGNISKLVIYSETHLHNFYNLGFGDKDETTGKINDSVVTNNGDSEKVLATVAATLYEFTNKFPEAMIFATGSTKARTRLYRMGISNNLDSIKPDFEVFGLTAEKEWIPFEIKREFEAFLVKRKKVNL